MHNIYHHRAECPSPPDPWEATSDVRFQSLDYYGECRPERGVARDLLDFVPIESSGLMVLAGDITAGGCEAAFVMSALQTLPRDLIADRRGDVATLVAKLNQTICESVAMESFAALFCASINPVLQQLRYINAGHEPALLVRKASGRVHRLERTGAVLGLTRRDRYRERAVLMQPGDVLVIFSDGISEAHDTQGRQFGDAGVLQIVKNYSDASAADLVARIMEAVDCFTALSRREGDRTVAVIRSTGQANKDALEEFAPDLVGAAA